MFKNKYKLSHDEKIILDNIPISATSIDDVLSNISDNLNDRTSVNDTFIKLAEKGLIELWQGPKINNKNYVWDHIFLKHYNFTKKITTKY